MRGVSMAAADRAPSPGWAALLAGVNGLRSVALVAGTLLYALMSFIVVTVLPSATAEIGGVGFYAWAATLFGVGALTGAATAVPLAARFGPRGTYRFGVVCFALGGAGC